MYNSVFLPAILKSCLPRFLLKASIVHAGRLISLLHPIQNVQKTWMGKPLAGVKSPKNEKNYCISFHFRDDKHEN